MKPCEIYWLIGQFLISLKGRVHCFLIQVVMNKCFLNLEKIFAQIHLVVFEKNAPLVLINDVTEPKARLL